MISEIYQGEKNALKKFIVFVDLICILLQSIRHLEVN